MDKYFTIYSKRSLQHGDFAIVHANLSNEKGTIRKAKEMYEINDNDNDNYFLIFHNTKECLRCCN